jgi:ABC-2 type transport system permease protein
MSAWRRELWFVGRDRAALLWLVLALLVAAFAIWNGHQEIASQRATIASLVELDRQERAAVAQEASDWGGLAYYSFHLTYDRPSDFAFAAVGQRDLAPWMHRIRMLALEGQIYETDAEQPEIALVGRFDFAYLAALLAPLLAIMLLHDLQSGERNRGRFEWLEATASDSSRIWLERLLIRLGLLAACLLLPLWVGAWLAGTSVQILLIASSVVLLHLVFWGGVCAWFDRRSWTGPTKLTLLLGVWLALAVVAPVAISAAADWRSPIPSGAEIILTQRETVNQAWDLPKSKTMDAFIERHPAWADHVEVERPFEWKWYYAFQQVGDQVTEPLSLAYREGVRNRDRLAGRLAWLSPPTWTERTLQSLAETDVAAMQSYEANVRAFHAALRNYYYPYLFLEKPLTPEALAQRPEFGASQAR